MIRPKWFILIALIVILPTCLFLAWLFGIIGWWKTIDSAVSPNGIWKVSLRVFQKPGPLYSWDDYYLQLEPRKKFVCLTPERVWRDTPLDISSPKEKHFLC